MKCKSSSRFSLNGGVERQFKSSQIKIANQILRIQIHQGLLRLHQMQNSRFHSIIVEGMSFADITLTGSQRDTGRQTAFIFIIVRGQSSPSPRLG